jgi:hypothetical protein
MASSDAGGEALESLLLAAAAGNGVIADTWPWTLDRGLDHDAVVGAMKSLMVDGYLVASNLSVEFWVLTEEAGGYVAQGSPEAQVFCALAEGAMDEAALTARLGESLVKVGVGKCLKSKWVSRDKATGTYSRLLPAIERDELVEQLVAVRDGSVADAALLKDLKKRQLINLVCVVCWVLGVSSSWRLIPAAIIPAASTVHPPPPTTLTHFPLSSFYPVPAPFSSLQKANIVPRGSWAKVGPLARATSGGLDKGAPRLWRVGHYAFQGVQL